MSVPAHKNHWLTDLAFETALQYFTPEELCIKYDISKQRYEMLQASKEFRQAVQMYRRQIDEEGQQFRVKARRIASEVLDVLFNIAADETAAAGDRISAVNALCRYAGFDKGAEAASGNNAFTVNIQVNA